MAGIARSSSSTFKTSVEPGSAVVCGLVDGSAVELIAVSAPSAFHVRWNGPEVEDAPGHSAAPVVIRIPPCTEPQVTGGLRADGTRNEYVDWQFGTSFYSTVGQFLSTYTEQSARDLIDDVRATLPMFPPFHDPDVAVTSGWFYNLATKNFHGATDVSKPAAPGADPTFTVHSIADGRVVFVDWTDLVGNLVIIEHETPAGTFRSSYYHLRNGLTHDLQMAKGIPDNPDERLHAYYLFARMDDPSPQLWGTEDHTIKVAVGDLVSAGQHIAWAGNTGYGGAGWGLVRTTNQGDFPGKAVGEPMNPDSGNTHLHFEVAIAEIRPRGGPRDHWMRLDPYGVYSDMSPKAAPCYELGKRTGFNRLLAPFLPNWHCVPLKWVMQYWGYYTGMGMALQTISVFDMNGEILTAGSFQSGLATDWRARLYVSEADFRVAFDDYWSRGMVPRQVDVTVDAQGQPRYSAIWNRHDGTAFYYHLNMTVAEWEQAWQKHFIADGLRVVDHAVVMVGGDARHSAFFKGGSDNSFSLWENMSLTDLQTKAEEMRTAGLRPDSLKAAAASSIGPFNGIWRPGPGSWPLWAGMTYDGYQARFDQVAPSHRLYRVQGYGNGMFAAIWTDQ